MKKIVLASASPRRRELLERFNLKFDIIPDNLPEDIGEEKLPENIVCRLAKNKCENVARKIEEKAIVIAADTIVVIDGKIAGKPKDKTDAFNMLSSLSGRVHEVYTGVSVKDTEKGLINTFFEKTSVKFKTLQDDEIEAYIKTGEPMDKAGAYGIQDIGSLFVERIDGDYFNVVGLPVSKLGEVLRTKFDVKILA